jgi:hypothetical protein
MSKSLFNSGCTTMLIAVFCFAIMIASIASAQEGESDAPAPKHSLKDGAWALQFQLGSAFSQRSYDDVVIFAKYHLSDKGAIRLGIDIDGDRDFGTLSSHRGKPPDDTLYSSSRHNMNRQGVNLISEYIKYTQIDPQLHFFLGAGPTFGFFRSKWEDNQRATYPPIPRSSIRKWEQYDWSVGISGVLGAEWFPTKRIGVIAEYGVSFDYRYQMRKSEIIGDSPTKSSRYREHMNYFSLDLLAAKIGIAVYF